MTSINIALWAPVAVLWASHLAARAAMQGGAEASALTRPALARRSPTARPVGRTDWSKEPSLG